jgi:hypothetical protein
VGNRLAICVETLLICSSQSPPTDAMHSTWDLSKSHEGMYMGVVTDKQKRKEGPGETKFDGHINCPSDRELPTKLRLRAELGFR